MAKLRSHCPVLSLLPAQTNAQLEPAVAQQAQVGGLLGHEHRREHRQDENARTKAQPPRDSSQVGEEHKRVPERKGIGGEMTIGVTLSSSRQEMTAKGDVVEASVIECLGRLSQDPKIRQPIELKHCAQLHPVLPSYCEAPLLDATRASAGASSMFRKHPQLAVGSQGERLTHHDIGCVLPQRSFRP